MNPTIQQNLFISFVVFIVLSALMFSTVGFVYKQSVSAIEKEISQTLMQIGKVISTSIVYEEHLEFSSDALKNESSYSKHLQKFQQIINENPDLFSITTTIEQRNGYTFVLHSDPGRRLSPNTISNSTLLSQAFRGADSKTETPYEKEDIEIYIPLKHEGDVYAVLGLCMKIETYKGKIEALNKSSGSILLASLLFCFIFSSLIVIIGNFKHGVLESKKMHSEKL